VQLPFQCINVYNLFSSFKEWFILFSWTGVRFLIWNVNVKIENNGKKCVLLVVAFK
jgi:hypothetical protein